MSATYRRPEEVWPTGGTPLVREVRSPYFMPVTEEILAEITRRIVAELDPEKVILFGSYAYGRPHPDEDYALTLSALRRKRLLTYGATFHAQQLAEKNQKRTRPSTKPAMPSRSPRRCASSRARYSDRDYP